MPLPREVREFLNENAKQQGIEQFNSSDDLFRLGVLDSFALVDFITILEQECDLKIPDNDVKPVNFQTVDAIEHYVSRQKG